MFDEYKQAPYNRNISVVSSQYRVILCSRYIPAIQSSVPVSLGSLQELKKKKRVILLKGRKGQDTKDKTIIMGMAI